MVGKVPADHPLRQSRKSRDFLYTVKKGFFKKGSENQFLANRIR
jgi:hypothetical protein